MDPFLAEIKLFGGSFAPRGWAFCDGQLLPISVNSALFSILGTIYGGDGRTTFALPDLRGRVPLGPRNGPGLSDYREGQKGGAQTNILNITQLPSHNHSYSANFNINASSGNATESSPAPDKVIATPGEISGRTFQSSLGFNAETPNTQIQGGAISGATLPTGGNQSVNNMQPFLAINYIIALQGVFPSRS